MSPRSTCAHHRDWRARSSLRRAASRATKARRMPAPAMVPRVMARAGRGSCVGSGGVMGTGDGFCGAGNRGFGGPTMEPSLMKFRASVGATSPQPIKLSRCERDGLSAVARMRYFQSAGDSLGRAAATRAAIPAMYPVA